VSKLSAVLDEYNVHAKSFRMAKERLKTELVHNLKIVLISNINKDGRIYNIPSIYQVVALTVGDVDTGLKRDIIMETHSGKLQQIDELHTSYLSFQYPLLFPYREDGYRHNVLHQSTYTLKKGFDLQLGSGCVLESKLEQIRHKLCNSTILEAERLNFIRRNQAKLRVDKYCNLTESQQGVQTEGSSRGKRVILPSSFIGGRRYMDQLYFDGMAICSHVGFPNFFVTFTCNP